MKKIVGDEMGDRPKAIRNVFWVSPPPWVIPPKATDWKSGFLNKIVTGKGSDR